MSPVLSSQSCHHRRSPLAINNAVARNQHPHKHQHTSHSARQTGTKQLSFRVVAVRGFHRALAEHRATSWYLRTQIQVFLVKTASASTQEIGEKGKNLSWKQGLIEIIRSFTSCSPQILTAIFPFGSTFSTAHTHETQNVEGHVITFFLNNFFFKHAFYSFVIGKIFITESNWNNIFGISVHSLVLVWYFYHVLATERYKLRQQITVLRIGSTDVNVHWSYILRTSTFG